MDESSPDPASAICVLITREDRVSEKEWKEQLKDVTSQDYDKLWSFCIKKVSECVSNALLNSGDEAADPTHRNTFLKVLQLTRWSLDFELNPCKSKIDLVNVFHDLIPLLDNDSDLVRLSLEICYIYYTSNMDQKRRFWINAFVYYLKLALQPDAPKIVFVKAWKMKDGLAEFLSSETDCQLLLELLSECAASESFYLNNHGTKLLACFLSVQESATEIVHKAVTSVIPFMNKKLVEAVANMYIEAWNIASLHMKQALKEICFEDFVMKAVLCNPDIPYSFVTCLNTFFFVLNHKRKPEHLSTMLHQCYEAILYRHLSVPNGQVRTSAARLFLNAFPELDDCSGREQQEKDIENQFNLIMELLKDPVPSVRVITVRGICNALKIYWDMLPLSSIYKVISFIIKVNARDACNDSRVAVCKGLDLLLQNRSSHFTLKSFLPSMKHCIDDPSSQVRFSFLKLLNTVKRMAVSHFWDIVPYQKLLTVLPQETPIVARKIVSLLKESFFPAEESSVELVHRCLTLISEDRWASRIFYRHARVLVPQDMIIKFMLTLCKVIRNHGVKNGSTEDMIDEEEENKENELNYSQCISKANDKSNTAEVNSSSSLTETDLEGLLDVLCILFVKLCPSEEYLQVPEQKFVYKKLLVRLKKLTELVLKGTYGVEVISSVFYMSTFLPHQLFPSAHSRCLSALRSLPEDVDSEQFEVQVLAMIRWNKGADVINIISDWVGSLNKQGEDEECSPSDREKKVRFDVSTTSKPELGLKFLKYLTETPQVWMTLVEKHAVSMFELWATLMNLVSVIQDGIISPQTHSILHALDVYKLFLKLTVILNDKIHPSSGVIFVSSQVFLLQMKKFREEFFPAVSSLTEELRNFCFEMKLELIVICKAVFEIGICNLQFAQEFYNFCIVSKTLGVDLPPHVILPILNLVLEYLNFADYDTDKKHLQDHLEMLRKTYCGEIQKNDTSASLQEEKTIFGATEQES